jgi:LemA protein
VSTLVWLVLGVIGFAVLVVLAIALWGIGTYNNFVRLKNLVAEGWSGIEVQLKRRSNLVPNLVATVQGYAEHESLVLQEVTQARASIGRGSVSEQAAAETTMAKSLMSLFAVAENYPDLKADKNFQQLQAELSDLEDVIQKARRYYNGTVRDFNTELELFPGNLIAGIFNFHPAEFFELLEEEDAAVPEVSFQN